MGAEGLRQAADLSVLANNYMETRLLAIRGVAKAYPELTAPRLEMTRYSLGQVTEDTGITVVDIQNRIVDFGIDAFWLSHEPWIVPEPFTPEAGELWSKEDIDYWIDVLAAVIEEALEKLAATDIQIGYPDTWRDYSSARTRRNAFWANVAAGRRFNVDFNRQQVGKPTNRDLWRVSPSSPDSYIILEINTMVLTAGTLQPPFFNPQASDAVNYGAMGIAVAHDLTHAIDATGAAIDLQLHPQNWWSDKDRRDFQKRAQCLVDQFEGYFIEPGVHHNGQQVRDETIADLAGVRIAYLALEKSMQTHPVPIVGGFTPEQQFFISWGQTTGHAMRLEAQRQLVSADPHPVAKFRVLGPLSNTPEFQQAFSCQAGAPMVRPPQTRCQVW